MTSAGLTDARARRTTRLWALALFVALICVYNANRTVLDEGDAVPSVLLPLTLVRTGKLSFDAAHFPELFKWKSRAPLAEQDDFYFVGWDGRFGEKTARGWHESGHLVENGPRYYLVESPRRHVYVSTFGPVPGLLVFPFVAAFNAIDPGLATKVALRNSVAKLGASSFVAVCAVLLFYMALRHTTRWRALFVALTYGLGTCAWAVSSQNIWQQTANQLFLVVGAYFFLGDVGVRRIAALAGLAIGAATACRATGVVVLAGAAVHLFLHHRRSVVPFVLGALPVPLAVGAYNHYYFGSPFTFAQELVGHVIAKEKTGSPELWQTPLHQGLAGLLLSPSRGLLVFSPLLGLSFWGIYRVWRDPAHRAMRPLAVATLVTMAAQCMWFDWWGGWTFGYRPWIDVVPYLVLFLVPVLEPMTRTALRRAAVGAAFAWGVFVQGVGAMTYDRSWNLRLIYVVRRPEAGKPQAFLTEGEARGYADTQGALYLGPSLCDIDLPYCRHRLWSLEDNLILYHVTHYRETRRRRMPWGWRDLRR